MATTTLRRTFLIEYAHRLRNTPGESGRIHGHTGEVVLELVGLRNLSAGMTGDPAVIDEIIDLLIDQMDHVLILNRVDYRLASVVTSEGFGRVLMVDGDPTAENLAAEIGTTVNRMLRQRNQSAGVLSSQFSAGEGVSAKWLGGVGDLNV